jgi:hypothetical protein
MIAACPGCRRRSGAAPDRRAGRRPHCAAAPLRLRARCAGVRAAVVSPRFSLRGLQGGLGGNRRWRSCGSSGSGARPSPQLSGSRTRRRAQPGLTRACRSACAGCPGGCGARSGRRSRRLRPTPLWWAGRGREGRCPTGGDDCDCAVEESVRVGEMLGRAVVAADLKLPVRTLLDHRCTDVIEPSFLADKPGGIEVMIGIRSCGVCPDGQDDRLIGHVLDPDSRWLPPPSRVWDCCGVRSSSSAGDGREGYVAPSGYGTVHVHAQRCRLRP